MFPEFLISGGIMFPEFLISGGIMLQILGPKYLKLFRSLITVLIGHVVKSVCDQRLLSMFRCSNNSFIMWLEILFLFSYSSILVNECFYNEY